MRSYIYADESGNFDFSSRQGASRYFILTSVAVTDHAIESDLLELRRELAWEGELLAGGFHATNDKQRVRDRVFDVLGQHDFRVDAAILEKRKLNPTRRTAIRLYGLAWYFHLTGLVPALASASDELLVVAAAVGENDMRSEFYATVSTIENTCTPSVAMRATVWSAATTPLLQVADYCAWAVQRKWERYDTRAYNLIRDKITSEFEAFGAHAVS